MDGITDGAALKSAAVLCCKVWKDAFAFEHETPTCIVNASEEKRAVQRVCDVEKRKTEAEREGEQIWGL